MTKTLRYIKPYAPTAAWAVVMKFVGSIAELFLPLLLDYIIDDIVPLKDISMVLTAGAFNARLFAGGDVRQHLRQPPFGVGGCQNDSRFALRPV